MIVENGADSSATRVRYPLISKRLRKRSAVLTLIGLLLVCALGLSHVFHKFTGADAPKCRSIYMYPSYARIDGFDTRYTKLAKKYHIYLYREQGKDNAPLHGDEIQLDGIPVLFIPGNAGSFKQARSIAAASADMYFDSKSSIENSFTKNLDFFTADFNEDFTAFHGQTMIDQASFLNDAINYILSLYSQSNAYKNSNRTLPKSVIIVGHSMGGIVARLIPTLPNHIKESINSIITLSSPHAAAPVTFDGDILRIYERINTHWRSSMDDTNSFFRNNVSVISITGGILDGILPADYTDVKGIIPESNGFGTFTTTIPEVWTPIDHLAIVWCDQLRHVIAKYLLETVNDDLSTKTSDLDARLRLARNLFLSGLEPVTHQDKLLDTNLLDMSSNFKNPISINEDGTFWFNKSNPMKNDFIFDISGNDKLQFQLLTSLHDIELLFCRTKDNKDCIQGSSSLSKIPRSSSATQYPTDSSWGSGLSPFRFISLNSTDLRGFETILLRNTITNNDDFLIVTIGNENNRMISNINPWEISMSHFQKSLDFLTSFTKTVSFPKLWSSLISYRLNVIFSEREDSSFNPLVRQYVNTQYESKWHLFPSSGSHDINMHNIRPFISVDDTSDKSLNLMFFAPPGQELRIKLSINWLLTFKMLFIRFRLAIASIPISLIALTLSYQFYYFTSDTSKFISFETALTNIVCRYSILILGFLSVTPLLSDCKILLRLLYLLDPTSLNNPVLNDHTITNSYMLGLREPFTWWIGPLFFTISVATLFLLTRIFNILELVAVKTAKLVSDYIPVPLHSNSEAPSRKYMIFSTRQLVGICFLFLLVMYYVPYQFAFLVISLIQIWTCVRLAILNYYEPSKYNNAHNFNMSFLILTIFMIPINAPIVVVFFRNIAIRWETAFRSHHNFLAIAPSLLLILRNSQFKLPVIKSKHNWLIVVTLSAYLSFYSFTYGIRNLYWVYHLYNILNGVFFVLTLM